MIDEKARVIVPDGGRKKTGAEQVSPLTDKALAVLHEIVRIRKAAGVVPLKGPVFTREDGQPKTKDMIQSQVEKAIKTTGVKKFTFHCYRNTALTNWARQRINVDVAMKASGHTSVQMHKHYVDLQKNDVAREFGCENVTEIVTRKRQATVSS